MAQGVELIQRFYDEMLGQGKVDDLGDLVTEDIVDHEPFPGQSDGIDGVREFIEMMRSSFSDLKATMGPSVESGDLASAEVMITAKHTGEFMGVPATDKSVEIESIDIIRIEDGKCAEHWGVTDLLSLMQQIGAVPAAA